MIIIKSPEEIEIMRQCGKILSEIMQRLKKETKAGTKTRELDDIVAFEARIQEAEPSFKNSGVVEARKC